MNWLVGQGFGWNKGDEWVDVKIIKKLSSWLNDWVKAVRRMNRLVNKWENKLMDLKGWTDNF